MEREWENEIKNEGSQIKDLFSFFKNCFIEL